VDEMLLSPAKQIQPPITSGFADNVAVSAWALRGLDDAGRSA
jgi:hypothetical protein